jgi:hypothetical protein
MATYSGYLLTGIPDNANADQLLVASGLTSSGTFTLASTLAYTYPTKTTVYSIDEGRWYKVAFKHAATNWQTPYSNAIDGAQILNNVPQLSITSTYDGISYSTPQDVYDRANMTTTDAAQSDVSYAISVARAFIDIKMSTVSVNRYSNFSQNVAQKKFNGLLRLLKDVEINFALSLIYKNLADDAIMTNVKNGTKSSSSISVGQTSIAGIEGSDTIPTAQYLDQLSTRYANYATSLLDTLTPNYVPLRYSENGTGYRQAFITFATDGSATFNFADGIILDRMDL